MNVGLLFPGQGSQTVGMGADLFEACPELLGESANEILGFDLRRMCLEGPEELLMRTENAQPALYALSYALWSLMSRDTGVLPAGVAGHSLGEYTALAAASVFEFEIGLEIVARRGIAMGKAAEQQSSGMAALLGSDLEEADAACQARAEMGGTLQIANINAPGQVVVAGSSADIEWLAEHGRDFGVRRTVVLKVAGAFHSSFMTPAAAELDQVLSAVEMMPLQIPVWANTTAAAHSHTEIRTELVRQMTSPVLFADSLRAMRDAGIDRFIHVGPGDVTAGLARRTLEDVDVHILSSTVHISELATVLSTMADTRGEPDAHR